MLFIIVSILFSFFQIMFAEQTISEHAEQVLNLSKYELPAPSIIGEREWKELQLDRLVTVLDRSTTSFGRWGLVQLLHPIADTKELSRRKEIVMFLVEHENEMRIFQEQLKRVKDVEKSLLAYWDKHDQLNQSAQQFYYTVFGLKDLNKSSLALNASTIMEMFNSWKYLISALALGGLSAEFQRWIHSEKENDKLDILGGISEGLAVPLRQHSPTPVILTNSKAHYNYKDYIRAFTRGSWGDRYELLFKGYSTNLTEIGLPLDAMSVIPSLGKLGAFVGATIPTLFFDYQWGNAVISTGQRIISMYRTLNDLQKRVADVAQCVDAIQKLQKIVGKQSPILRSYLNNNDDYDTERKDLINNLLTKRFLKKSDYLYSRGHVLTMHLDITQKKKTLIPLLHSVALLDAYCAIAQLYKESQNEPVVFSFPEFVESPTPFLDYHDAWLPLLSSSQAITNNLILGAHNYPGKIIITGPNGSGKSTILKTLGILPVLAQSWGIVPAKSAEQTLFSIIRTNLAADEDLQKKLSKGMAGMKAMNDLYDDIRKFDQQDILVLIDEPYGGMVDAEAAKRIYDFGMDISGYSQALVAIATHTKKPIQLAQSMPNIFANYQVKIEETRLGTFKRLFKLEPGAAMWWFNDENRRSRFVDWLSGLTSGQ